MRGFVIAKAKVIGNDHGVAAGCKRQDRRLSFRSILFALPKQRRRVAVLDRAVTEDDQPIRSTATRHRHQSGERYSLVVLVDRGVRDLLQIDRGRCRGDGVLAEGLWQTGVYIRRRKRAVTGR